MVALTLPALSRAASRIVAPPAGPARTLNDARYDPLLSFVAPTVTGGLPGWVNVALGRVDSGSIERKVTVTVAPARTLVADSAALNASTVTDRVRTTVPSDVVAVSSAT